MVAAACTVAPAQQDAANPLDGCIDRLLAEHLDRDGVADDGVDGREHVDIAEHIADNIDLMAVMLQPMGEALGPLVVEEVDPVIAGPAPEGGPAMVHLAQEEIGHLAPYRRQSMREIECIGEGAHEPFQRRVQACGGQRLAGIGLAHSLSEGRIFVRRSKPGVRSYRAWSIGQVNAWFRSASVYRARLYGHDQTSLSCAIRHAWMLAMLCSSFAANSRPLK